MDGLEFTERVKQDVTTSHIPVILLTAKTDENDHTEGYLRGADAYITKLSTPRIWNCWYRISKRAGNRALNTSNRQKN